MRAQTASNASANPALELVRRSATRCVLAVAALAFICNLGTLAVPLFNMQVFGRVLPTRDLGTMGALACGLAICLLAWAVLEVLRSAAMEILAARIARQLSIPLIQAASLAPRPDLAAGECMADLEMLRTFLASRACMVPFDIAWTPVLLLALLAMHWALAAMGLLSLLILTVLNVLGDAISRRALLAANEASATAMRGAVDGVNAAEAVIALGMLPILTQRWRSSQQRAADLVETALLRARAVSAATNALRAGMTGAMVALGLALALNGMSSSASMVAGNMILGRLLLPFGSVAATRRQWIDVLAAWRRLQAVLSGTAQRRYETALPAPEPKLVVENLSYFPPKGDRALLRSVSFTVEPGESVAIIGPSSAGKSTLLRLIVGMAPPTAGGVYLDGNSSFLWEREDFARHAGYMPQRPTLLEESVADNIARMQTVDMAAVVRAAKMVGVHRTIAALPQGYATRLSGNVLSGGQRQRVALARALYGEPKLLALDEPSAFLDESGEADLVGLLGRLRASGVTVLLVTHRPSLLRAMDKVVVLQAGSVAQFSPASELYPELKKASIRLVKNVRDQVAVS